MNPNLPLGAVADSLMLYRFRVEAYHRLIDDGILPEDGSYELLRGLILKKDNGTLGEENLGHKPPHALVVALLSSLIVRINTLQRHLRIQLPIVLSDEDAPEPDGSIVKGTARDYSQRLPGPGDVLCVFEVAHSSLERDESEKLPLYANAAIAQCVIVNLRSAVVESYTEPDPRKGTYGRRVTLQKGQTLQINLGSELLDVDAGELLP